MSNDVMDQVKGGSPKIMGIVNVTPDSFSDGGQYNDVDRAIAHGVQLLKEGADILDIGGESTRPNAEIVSVEQEIERVIPVIEGLSKLVQNISIDTRNAKTMRAAIEAGVNMINDVSALSHDPQSLSVAAQSGLPVCLMHMQGSPQDMQDRPTYENVIDDIMAYFEARLKICAANGITQDQIILDPGIGFGKTLEHNLSIIKHIDQFKRFGCPVLLGTSRKSFIGAVTGADNAQDRLGGSLASALYGVKNGADILRVHDVKETRQAIDINHAILSAL